MRLRKIDYLIGLMITIRGIGGTLVLTLSAMVLSLLPAELAVPARGSVAKSKMRGLDPGQIYKKVEEK